MVRGRGVNAGGKSSLGYLFGSGETVNNANGSEIQNKPDVASQPRDGQIPAGVAGTLTNNYHRADGQNCGNFLTDRPTTKVHTSPGGVSSLGYLFGGSGK